MKIADLIKLRLGKNFKFQICEMIHRALASGIRFLCTCLHRRIKVYHYSKGVNESLLFFFVNEISFKTFFNLVKMMEHMVHDYIQNYQVVL